MLYKNIKYTFESFCFLFYITVFGFSFIQKDESLCFKLQGIFGLVIVIFSIASKKDKVSPLTQNTLQFILGIIFFGVLAYSFFVSVEKKGLLFYFSIASAFIGTLRFFEFVFCVEPYLRYLSIEGQEENVV